MLTRMCNEPNSLPIWARLKMIKEGVIFNEVTCWSNLSGDVINLHFPDDAPEVAHVVSRYF